MGRTLCSSHTRTRARVLARAEESFQLQFIEARSEWLEINHIWIQNSELRCIFVKFSLGILGGPRKEEWAIVFSLIEIVAKHEFHVRDLPELRSEEKINYTIEHRSHTKFFFPLIFSFIFVVVVAARPLYYAARSSLTNFKVHNVWIAEVVNAWPHENRRLCRTNMRYTFTCDGDMTRCARVQLIYSYDKMLTANFIIERHDTRKKILRTRFPRSTLIVQFHQKQNYYSFFMMMFLRVIHTRGNCIYRAFFKSESG